MWRRYWHMGVSPRTEPVLFAVLTRGRTGSTPVCEDLDMHPDVTCHQEVFRLGPLHTYTDKAESFLAYRERTGGTVEAYLAHLGVLEPGKRRVGFKLLINHFEERQADGLEEAFYRLRIPAIYLVRDPLSAGLSAAIAAARGVYNMRRDETYTDSRRLMAARVSLDIDVLRDEIAFFEYWQQHWQSQLARSGLPFMTLRYEDYVSDRLAAMNRVFVFLGVAPLLELAENPYQRVTGEHPLDGIENAEAVSKVLSEMARKVNYAALLG